MKKIFTLLTMALLAIGASAQKITFSADDIASAGDWSQGKEFSNGDFKITLADDQKKMAIDANNAYFGTADSYEKFTHRLKSGAKSQGAGKLCQISVTIPSNGDLKVYVRTGSNSATDRSLVIAQNGETVFNQVIQESQAVSVEMEENIDADKNPTGATNVYPVVSVKVTAGTALITFPTGSMNFYGFEFVSDGTAVIPVDPHAATTWDFTQELSAADASNLESDNTNWTFVTDKNYWENNATLVEGRNVFTALKANGEELDIAKGITFARDDNAGLKKSIVRIAPSKFVAVNGSKITLKLSELAKDDVIRLRFKGAGESERSLTPANATVTDGSLTTADTEVHEVALKTTENGSVTFTTTNGFQFLAITINTALPEYTGISVINAETKSAADAPVYNLSGQRVDENYRGVVIKNGKKMIK